MTQKKKKETPLSSSLSSDPFLSSSQSSPSLPLSLSSDPPLSSSLSISFPTPPLAPSSSCSSSSSGLSLSYSYGGSLRVAIMNSLRENETEPEPVPLPPKPVRRSSSNTQPKPRLSLSPNPTHFPLWYTPITSKEKIKESFFHSLPIEILCEVFCDYLSIIDLCGFRATCCLAWGCVSRYAFERSIIPLCQGEYVATCSSTGMMNAKEFGDCGVTRPKWDREHNAGCQICSSGQLDVFDCYCYNCNVSYHRVCILQAEQEGHGLGLDPDVQPFLCTECQNAQETPVAGFPLLLPPSEEHTVFSSSQSKRTDKQNTEASPCSPSSISCVLSPSLPPSLSSVDQMEVESEAIVSTHTHSSEEKSSSASIVPSSVGTGLGGCSLRVALRNSLLETQLTPLSLFFSPSLSPTAANNRKKIKNDQRMDANSSRKRLKQGSEQKGDHQICRRFISSSSIWWAHSSRLPSRSLVGSISRSPSFSFRLIGGFNSSNLTPNHGIYEYSTLVPSPLSLHSFTWSYSQLPDFPKQVPSIHSNLAIVIDSDRCDNVLESTLPPSMTSLDEDSSSCSESWRQRIWCFSHLRDRSDLESTPLQLWRREVCYDLGDILETSSRSGSHSSWRWTKRSLDGETPAPRVSAASCYCKTLNVLFLHGGLVRECKLNAEEIGQTGEDSMTSSGYISSDNLYCLPISEPVKVTVPTESISRIRNSLSIPPPKMTTRQTSHLENITTSSPPAVPQVKIPIFNTLTWTDISSVLDPSIPCPSARHGHTITEVGSQLWLFGGLGLDGHKKKQLNDLYLLDLTPLLSSSSICQTPQPLAWTMPSPRGSVPPRRAGHSAVAMGCQLIIFGGANGSVFLSDLHILHTPTVTWSSVKLSIPTSVSDRKEGWAKAISKRLRPSLFPVSSNQFIVYGGGKVCDLATPSYGDIPSDSYLITLSPLTPYGSGKNKKSESSTV